MKRIFRFGSFSDNSICMGIFITSVLIIYRFVYFSRLAISIESTSAQIFIFNVLNNYVKYFEPIVLFIWIKFICEFLFKLLKRN